MKPLQTLMIAFALTGGIVAAPMNTPARAEASQTDQDIELADVSQLAPINLPDGAMRAKNKEDVGKIEAALKAIAETNHGSMGKVEVLIWQGKAAVKQLPDSLKEAGYQYKARPAFDSEAGEVTPFGAVKEDGRSSLLGMWIRPKSGISLLAWGVFKEDSGSKTEADSETDAADVMPDSDEASSGDATEKPSTKTVPASAVKTASATGGGTPADLFGSWSWTTVSGVNYENATTGQMLSPSGMSAKFTFLRGGRYKFFFYIHQRTYSYVSESATTEEGTLTFNGDGTFTTHPEHGHYNGHMGSKLINRDMTGSEKKSKTYTYEWRTEGGKRQLYAGPSASSLSHFKRDN